MGTRAPFSTSYHASFNLYGEWKLESLVPEGDYTVDDTLAEIVDARGTRKNSR